MKLSPWGLGAPLVFFVLFISPALAYSQEFEWRLFQNADSLDFQLSNNVAFWSLSPKVEEPLKPYLQYEGWVLGDPHPENFGVLYSAEGRVLAPNDFDDGGEGPFALDLLRYLSTTHGHSSFMLNNLIDSYVNGLCGSPPLLPEFMDSTLHSDSETKGFRKGAREHFPVPKILREKFMAHLPAGKLIDAVVTSREKAAVRA
ncbi:MAG: DUF2252 family protein [Bdellovibrionaceae bacterium]|nr:DUF2252 family protein [Pseudobdellovibrionaceae bacterium]